MQIWLQSLVSVLIVSFISLIGVLTLAISEDRLKKPIQWLIGLAIGALFGDAVFHLLPESFEALGQIAGLYIVSGFVLFFMFDKFLHWRHHHASNQAEKVEPVGWLNLLADGAHNLIDGMLIAASYLISPPTGYATTLAVILHEIPQELGDYGILREANFSKWSALFWNFLSGLFAVIGMALVAVYGFSSEDFAVKMLAFTAGGFFYIIVILLRKLSEDLTAAKTVSELFAIGVGLVSMWLLKFFG
jgi:zinc and cadmium transporter